MKDNNFCNCHDCNRSYRNMLEHMCQEDQKLDNFKNHLKMHYLVCSHTSCIYAQLYVYLKDKYPDGFGYMQMLQLPHCFRECVCRFHWERNAPIDD